MTIEALFGRSHGSDQADRVELLIKNDVFAVAQLLQCLLLEFIGWASLRVP